MKTKSIVIAIAVALAGGTTTSASALELHGYIRSGMGGNGTGGGQTCLALGQFGFKFRLGNECETYGELQLDETLYRDKTGLEFKFSSMLAFQTAQRRTYDSLKTDSDFNDIALRQAWIGAKVPQLGNTTWWIGNRFYHRKDVHMIDFYYWDPSGYGVGVEDVDLGIAKLAVSVFGTPFDQLKTDEGVENTPPPFHGTQARGQVWRPDVRVYGIPFPGGGNLELGVDLFITAANTRSGVVSPPQAMLVSPWFTAQHQQPNVLGGFNTLVLQYAMGSAAVMNAFPQYGNPNDSRQFRVIDYFIINPAPQFTNHFIFVYQNIKQRYGACASGSCGDYNSGNLFTFGVRPAYHFNDWFKLQGEFGAQILAPSDTNSDGVAGNRTLGKFTIAPTIVAGSGPFSRPELRLFLTYAAWNTAAQQRNVAGFNSWGLCDPATTTSPFGCDKHAVTFGAQMEAWF